MDMKEVMTSLSRIPEDYPVGDADQLKADLIEQICAFQDRYEFSGVKHTPESLNQRSFEWLERLCDMMLFGIATSKVRDKTARNRSDSPPPGGMYARREEPRMSQRAHSYPQNHHSRRAYFW